MERCIKTRYNVEEAIQYVIELSEYSELSSLESDCDDEDLIIQDIAAEWQFHLRMSSLGMNVFSKNVFSKILQEEKTI